MLSFINVGITFEEVGQAVGPENAEKWTQIIKDGIEKDRASFEGAGCYYEFIGYGSWEGMGRLEQKLKEREWTGVSVGWGIRKTVEMSFFFEKLVNAIHTTLPNTTMLFNTAPDGTFDAARRWYPEIRAGQGNESLALAA